jgi:hypothetical protein
VSKGALSSNPALRLTHPGDPPRVDHLPGRLRPTSPTSGTPRPRRRKLIRRVRIFEKRKPPDGGAEGLGSNGEPVRRGNFSGGLLARPVNQLWTLQYGPAVLDSACEGRAGSHSDLHRVRFGVVAGQRGSFRGSPHRRRAARARLLLLRVRSAGIQLRVAENARQGDRVRVASPPRRGVRVNPQPDPLPRPDNALLASRETRSG